MGLIDDPWQIKDDAIIDEELSENSMDSKDILALRKPPSEHNWVDDKWEREKEYHDDYYKVRIVRSSSLEVRGGKKINFFKR